MEIPPEVRSKLVPFTRKITPPAPPKYPLGTFDPPKVKTPEQRIAELELDVFRLVESVVDLNRMAEEQQRLSTYMVKALVYLSNRMNGKV